jgi:hypothetical protein
MIFRRNKERRNEMENQKLPNLDDLRREIKPGGLMNPEYRRNAGLGYNPEVATRMSGVGHRFGGGNTNITSLLAESAVRFPAAGKKECLHCKQSAWCTPSNKMCLKTKGEQTINKMC